MSPRRDIFVALSCCCLVLSFLGIQARNLPETAVSKRDISDWFSYLDDLLYDSDSDSDEGTEKILVCSNCTVVVQPVSAGGAAPGSTDTNVAPGTTAPAQPAPAQPAPAPPAVANPAPAVPPGAPVPAASPAAANPAPAASPAAANPVPAASPAAANPAPAAPPAAANPAPADPPAG